MKLFVTSLLGLTLITNFPMQAKDWGCYDSQPGHSTAEEKAPFVEKVSALAAKAERDHGIPAAAIAAMSIVESGYGWTRTAEQANNFFGWKYNSSAAAGGRPGFTLECQPQTDVNNKYIVFADAADVVDFVASKLATMDYYRKDAEAYRHARASGQPVVVAVKAWVVGIANPYNCCPEKYAKTVSRLMNDPISPSDKVSARNLYRLSESPQSSPSSAASSISQSESEGAELYSNTRAWFSTHISKRECEEPVFSFARWSGFPVRRCLYADSGVEVHTYMLNPSADQLAHWTVTACADAKASDIAACTRAVSKTIVDASSGVFPVAGFIPEPASSGGGQGNSMQCFLFRDGVTITTVETPSAPKAVGNTCPEPDNEGDVVKARKYARVASTTRGEYEAAGGTEPVGSDAEGSPKWLDVVRAQYQEAWNSERNALISAKAKSLKAAGAFR